MLWRTAQASGRELAALAQEICQVPAPAFQEGARGDWAARHLSETTGQAAASDSAGNRWVTLPGRLGAGPQILVCAHLDTVFPPDTDCTVRQENGRLIGPGIGDNASGLAILLQGARLLASAGLPFRGELIVAADVGEEGLGDLRGARALCARFGKTLDGFLSLDGGLGQVVGVAVGVRRYRVSVQGPGGHSWSAFGTPSAIHHLSRVAASLADLEVPAAPRTTFNIGVFEGGTSVNTVAEYAHLQLDLRSVDSAALDALDVRAQAAIHAPVLPKELKVTLEKIGERPSGDSSGTIDWIDTARAALAALQIPMKVTASSTDANVPLALGLRASTLGISRGGKQHTVSEWLDPESLPLGLEAALLTVLTALAIFPTGSKR